MCRPVTPAHGRLKQDCGSEVSLGCGVFSCFKEKQNNQTKSGFHMESLMGLSRGSSGFCLKHGCSLSLQHPQKSEAQQHEAVGPAGESWESMGLAHTAATRGDSFY